MEEEDEVKEKKEKEKEWTLIEDKEKCSACTKEGVQCWVDLLVIQKWIQDWMEEEKKERAKPVTQNLSGTNCERCTQKKVVSILPVTQKMRVGKVSRSKVSGSKASSVVSSSQKRGAKQLEVEILVTKQMRVMKAGDEEEEDIGAVFQREVLAVLSRLASRVERIAVVAEEIEFRRE